MFGKTTLPAAGRVAAFLSIGAAFAGTPSADSRQATYQRAAQTVAVYATVLDKDGRLVPNLTKKDFQIFDNGKPAEITVFSNDRQALTVALMLDASDSMQTRLTLVKDSTRTFIDALEPADRLSLGSFAEEIAVSPLLTSDKTVLRRVLDEEVWPGGMTPLWTAIDEAMSAFVGETSRRVVLTLTDGYSTTGRIGYFQARTRAIQEGTMIYVVGMEGTTLGRDAAALANETGGGHFEVKRGESLAATFAKVANELRHQYALGFTPVAPDGEVHSIDVFVAKPGLVARARKSYVSPK